MSSVLALALSLIAAPPMLCAAIVYAATRDLSRAMAALRRVLVALTPLAPFLAYSLIGIWAGFTTTDRATAIACIVGLVAALYLVGRLRARLEGAPRS